MFGGLILKKSIKNIMGSIPVESKIYFKNYLILKINIIEILWKINKKY